MPRSLTHTLLPLGPSTQPDRLAIALCLLGVVFMVLVLLPWIQPSWRVISQHQSTEDGGAAIIGSPSHCITGKVIQSVTNSSVDQLSAVDSAKSGEFTELDGSIERAIVELKNEPGLINKLKRQLEVELITKLSDRAWPESSGRSPHRRRTFTKVTLPEQQRLIVEALQQMTPEGLAELVQDLVQDDRTESALAVLSVLEGNRTARVLVLVAASQPQLAASLTKQLRDAETQQR